MGIPMRLPPVHPFNPLMALRLIIAAGSNLRAVETVFDAIFEQGRDVSSATVIDQLARKLDVQCTETALNSPAIKEKLRQNTTWAITQGIFGVPTLMINDEIFWGHDAFDMALDYLKDPRQFQDNEMRKVETLPVGIVRQRQEPSLP